MFEIALVIGGLLLINSQVTCLPIVVEDGLIASKGLDYPGPPTFSLLSFGQIVGNSSLLRETGNNPQLIIPDPPSCIVLTINTIGRARRVEMILLLRNIYY